MADEQNQQQNGLPTLDLTDYEKKLAAGIFSWRFDEKTNLVYLDSKEFNGGIETGNVWSYPFSELHLEKLTNEHKGVMLMLDMQILQLREQQEDRQRQFDLNIGSIANAVKEMAEKGKKAKK